jgi:hypothetical protein
MGFKNLGDSVDLQGLKGGYIGRIKWEEFVSSGVPPKWGHDASPPDSLLIS